MASSWRNSLQPEVVSKLLSLGHDVYDFRNPGRDEDGFDWAWVDIHWEEWTPSEYQEALGHPLAEKGFRLDREAMNWADTFLLLLPCGASAHLEAGWAIGAGKPTLIYVPARTEAEMMYKMASKVAITWEEVEVWLEALPQRLAADLYSVNLAAPPSARIEADHTGI